MLGLRSSVLGLRSKVLRIRSSVLGLRSYVLGITFFLCIVYYDRTEAGNSRREIYHRI